MTPVSVLNRGSTRLFILFFSIGGRGENDETPTKEGEPDTPARGEKTQPSVEIAAFARARRFRDAVLRQSQHGIIGRPWFKRAWTPSSRSRFERSAYIHGGNYLRYREQVPGFVPALTGIKA